jgi:hypothetical protein
MFKDKRKSLKLIAQTSGAIGSLAYLALTRLNEGQTEKTLLVDILTGIFTLGFLIGGLALLGLGLYVNGGRNSKVSFAHSLKNVVGKAFLYVIIPSMVLTAILCLLFLRN